jgi:hypothetical protein
MLAPIRVQDVYSLVQQMIQSPADQVRLVSQLRSMVQSLPPPHSELISRARFKRAGLWSYVANFFNVANTGEPPVEVIRVPHDSWIRGVHAYALPESSEDFEQAESFQNLARMRDQINEGVGTNFRGLFEVNWRINTRQGFISSGTGELLAPATLVTGNGLYPSELDWRLQQEDTIEVRVRNTYDRLFPITDEDPPTPLERTIPWICVIFWAEELPQP